MYFAVIYNKFIHGNILQTLQTSESTTPQTISKDKVLECYCSWKIVELDDCLEKRRGVTSAPSIQNRDVYIRPIVRQHTALITVY